SVNVGRLQAAVDAGRIDSKAAVTAEALVEAGVIRRAHDGVRLLGDGELKAKLTIEVAYASEAARAAVEKAGGSVKMLEAEKAEARAATPMKGRKTPSKKPARKQARIEERNAAIAKAVAAPREDKAPAAKSAKKEKAAKKADAE